ncbi:MAG TPA: cyanophycin synthetase, partial [Leptolyngbya sp.]|nr:cyanophycin synthetase [Leptolyngbya sp.]
VIGQLPIDAKAVIDQRIADLDCPVVYPEPSQLIDGWAHQGALKYQLPLQGTIQLHNSAIAIATINFLRQQNYNISDRSIINGIANTKWAGRLQWYNWKDHQILIDGAHNPASAEALRQYIDQIGKAPIQWIIGMLSTKDHADVFKALLRSNDSLLLVPVPDHSSAEPTELAILAWELCPTLASCRVYPDVRTALETATKQPQLIVLCGSLYLIGNFFKQQKK